MLSTDADHLLAREESPPFNVTVKGDVRRAVIIIENFDTRSLNALSLATGLACSAAATFTRNAVVL